LLTPNSHSNKSKNALIVFTRYPEVGKVKTRLAKETSDQFAKDFYQLCAESIFSEITLLSNSDKYIFYSEEKMKNRVIEWTNNEFLYALQVGSNLGEKMYNAFKLAFSYAYQSVILVGTDIPDLSKNIINSALIMLDKKDAVIGPAGDGGYYLLGLKKNHKDLFENIKWGSGAVFNLTMEIAKTLSLKVGILLPLIDIDKKENLDNWLEQASNKSLKKKIVELNRL
jgi:rSAM/selenodomain-associated transferase 1